MALLFVLIKFQPFIYIALIEPLKYSTIELKAFRPITMESFWNLNISLPQSYGN